MKHIVILGGGLVGRAIAFDLFKKFHVTIIDNNAFRLRKLKLFIPAIETIEADLSKNTNITTLIDTADLVIGALPPSIGSQVLRSVIEAGKDSVSISTLVGDISKLDMLAIQNNVTAVIDAGIAPGITNLILGYHLNQMVVNDYECLFGGLPESSEPPFYHRDFYPTQVLFEEYLNDTETVENGKIKRIHPLNHIVQVNFSGVGVLDAISYNGLNYFSKIICKNIQNLTQKMLRIPGHLDFVSYLYKTGLLSSTPVELDNGIEVRPIDVTAKAMTKCATFRNTDNDLIALRITLRNDVESYVYQLIDKIDNVNHIPAMARTTGFTCTAISRLILCKAFTQKGIITPEVIGMHANCFSTVINDLRARELIFDVKHNHTEAIAERC